MESYTVGERGLIPRVARMSALAFAFTLSACSTSGGGSPVPAASIAPVAGSSTVAVTGVAYIPDGGSASPHGVQVVHFEDVNGNLLSSPASSGGPAVVTFPSSVGLLAFASDASAALAADSVSSGAPFTQLQDVFGANTSVLSPVGTAYDVTQVPSPAPSTTPTVSDVTSLAIVGTGTNAIGVAVGSASNGVLGVSSLQNAPPQYAQLAPFTSSSYTVTTVPAGARNNIIVANDSSEALVRGSSDLIAFQISAVATGSQFNATAYSASLGTTNVLRGRGGMAFDPAADGTAIVLQAPGPDDVTLINGLPTGINVLTSVTLSTRPHAVAWAPNGQTAVVAADGGYYTFSGLGSQLTPVATTPVNPTFIGCDGASHTFSAVTSIAISSDSRYIALFGPSDASCSGGANGSLVVLPYVPPGATASPTPVPSSSSTPAPSSFVQNNLTIPAAISSPSVTGAADQDYMIVK